MAGDSGYATNLRVIPIDFFVDMIKDAIKTLIHTYGHKDCGLRHKELCEEIRKIIFKNKKILFHHMDPPSKDEWNTNWDKQRNGIFNKLFREEGFINMCYPFKNIAHQDLYQLLSRHVNFCKEKDKRRSAIGENPEYNECVIYNSWIEAEKASFTPEFLQKVSRYSHKSVKKYFSTKEHPQGHDPRNTYLNSKLNCTLYKSLSINHQQKPVEKTQTNKSELPSVSNIRQGSQGKDGKSAQDGDTETAKTKPDVKNLSQTESSPDSPTSPLINTKVDSTANSQDISLQPKAPDFSVNRDGGTKELTPKQGESPTNIPSTARVEVPPQAGIPSSPLKDSRLTPSIQSAPPPNATTSLSSSLSTVKNTTSSQTPVTSSNLTVTSDLSLKPGSLSPPDQHPPPLPPANEGQDNVSHSTVGTSSDTQTISNPTKSVPSTTPVDSSLSLPQVPVLSASPVVTAPEVLGAPASSSTSTITTTVTTTTATTSTVTIPAISTIQNLISSPNQAPGILGIPQPPTEATPSGTKVTSPATDSQQTPLSSPTPIADKDTEAKSAPDESPKPEGSIKVPGIQLPVDTNQASIHPPIKSVNIPDSSVQKIPHQINQQNNTIAVQQTSKIIVVSSTSDESGSSVNIHKVNTKTDPKVDSKVRINNNDNSSIIPEGFPPLTHIIPTFLVILGTLTLLFQLYKYLKRIFKTPQKPTYESPNITVHELEDPNLVGQTVENDVYTKLIKIIRYKQEMQERKKKNKKTLIEVHMEVLEEHKYDEWELHKGDFLEICLRGFINEENDTYLKLPNSELTINNINEKTIEDIQKQEILWNNWIENHRIILEQWKKEEWFHILKNKWKNEEQKYKEKNDKLQENTLNEKETYSIVSQKEIWKQWISKQAILIDMFNKEDWFKSMVYVQNKEKNNYHVNEYNDITVTNENQLKSEKRNHEYSRSKDIIQKLMVQIHMMVLEECIKEDIIKQKELCIDNFIEDIHTKNNYEEKRNIPQCDTDDVKVHEFEEIKASINK
ncbi:STP1 protein [Plasmodium ovale]|uniref:STP1 protein n=1 Tax=Plasmodium ovale TaxID=36330 RepID=A0A1C3KFG3_PLAOA|nr:STP1 protein [Plasmodium ovale]